MKRNVIAEAIEKTITSAEIADRATAEIFHIIDNMPENSGIEYGMKSIHVKCSNNNTYVVIADTKRFGKNQIMFESVDIMQCVEYVKNSIHIIPAESEVQEITSADTSINSESIPVVFSTLAEKANKLNTTLDNAVIFDTGCGKYPEIIADYFKDYKADYIGRDKFNQPENINNQWIDNCKAAGSVGLNRIFTSSNVMNVIKGENFRIAYLQDIMQYMKPGEKLYITVYDGDRTGIGRITKTDKNGSATCWQENRKYKDYIPECLKAGFTSVTPKYNMLICEL